MAKNTVKSLMAKTKAELVNIIVSQDNTVEDLRKDYDSMSKSFDVANRNLEEHQATIDELTSEKVELQMEVSKLDKQRKDGISLNWLVTALFASTLIVAIIL